MIRKFFILIFLVLFSFSTGQGIYFLKKGFSARRIHSLNRFTNPQFTDEAQMALKKSYRYLGRGRQCFAFESEDGKYVLKFPRTDIYQIPLWMKVLKSEEFLAQYKEEKRQREEFIVKSFEMAEKELKSQTGTIALHLGMSPKNQEMLTVIDAMGSKHKLPLFQTSFVIQKKKPLLMKCFSEAMKKGDTEDAKKILTVLLDAISERAKKGILNRDRSFLRNYGYEAPFAYQIDIGSFFKDSNLSSSQSFEKSFRDSTDPIREWLEEHEKEMLPFFEEHVQRYLTIYQK